MRRVNINVLTSEIIEILARILGGVKACKDICGQNDAVCTETSILAYECMSALELLGDTRKAYITRCSCWFRSSRSGSRDDTRRRPSRSHSLSLRLSIRDPWFLTTITTTTIPYIKFVLSTSEQPNEDRAQQK